MGAKEEKPEVRFMNKRYLIHMGLTIIFILNGCAPHDLAPTPAPPPDGKFIVGYYPSWAASRGYLVKDIPAEKLTHINYAFANLSSNGECVLGDPAEDIDRVYSKEQSVIGRADKKNADFSGTFNQLRELKKRYPHLKILISIGGWTWSSNFSTAAKDDASRQRFSKSCIDLFLKQYEGVFDGVDIDWEYPVSGGLTTGTSADKKNFTLLLQELRGQLDAYGAEENKQYLLTIAAPVGPGNIQNIELGLVASLVDWINLMGYDFHGTWESTTNFNAPLFRTAQEPADKSLNVDAAVQRYLIEGVPADKLVLGVPFYGKGWQGVPNINNGLYQIAKGAAPGTWEPGSYEYKDIINNFLAGFQRFWDADAYVPWLYDPQSGIFISYDDPQSLSKKAGYARDQGLKGVMIWELSQGDETLLDAIYQGFAVGGPARPTPIPTVAVPRPFEHELRPVSGITLDGQLFDWPDSPDFILDDQSQVVYQVTSKSWTGPQDLSTKAFAGWAPEGLYFAFLVVDDIHIQPDADSNLWHGDHMELQFDTMLDKDYTNPGMNGDDYQIGLSLGDFAGVRPVAYAWFNGPEAPGVISQIRMAYTQTKDGYILEAFLPGEVLAGISLAEGATFGMNISPSDADSAAQGQKAMLSTSPIRTYADPTTFGKITLVR